MWAPRCVQERHAHKDAHKDAYKELDDEHRRLLSEKAVGEETRQLHLNKFNDLVKDLPKDKTRNIRVMTWNVLAEGLSHDGFIVQDVLNDEVSRDVAAEVEEVVRVRNEEGNMDALKKQFSTERSERNHTTMVDWRVRWSRIKAVISRMQPDVVVLQEMDHVGDGLQDLRALGFECSMAGKEYKPAHTKGIEQPDTTQYLEHLERTGYAFAPTVPSNAKRLSNKRGVKNAEDDGVLILWRADLYEPVNNGLTFLATQDSKRKRNESIVRVQLRRQEDLSIFSVIGAHLHSGSSERDEKLRIQQLTSPSLDKSGKATGASIIDLFEETIKQGPTLFCVDTNSDPQRSEDETVWKAMHVRGVKCVWDEFFDEAGTLKPSTVGDPKEGIRPITSNKMRGPLSAQPKIIGEHTYLVRRL